MGTKRILALLLALALSVSVSACGEQSPIVGNWLGVLDYSQILQEELSDEEVWEEIPISGVILEMLFSFEADGTFSTKITQESIDAMVETLLDIAVDGLAKKLEDRQETVPSEQILRQMLEDKIDVSALTAPLEFTFGSGYYVYGNNRIYIGSQERSLRVNPEENAAEILDVTIAGDTITVTQLHSRDTSAEGFLPGLLPFDLVKQ